MLTKPAYHVIAVTKRGRDKFPRNNPHWPYDAMLLLPLHAQLATISGIIKQYSE